MQLLHLWSTVQNKIKNVQVYRLYICICTCRHELLHEVQFKIVVPNDESMVKMFYLLNFRMIFIVILLLTTTCIVIGDKDEINYC